jgi:hypothetical protein
MLTNEPDKATRTNFIAQRIRIDGVLNIRQRRRLASVPAAYLLASDRVIAWRHREGPVRRIELPPL